MDKRRILLTFKETLTRTLKFQQWGTSKPLTCLNKHTKQILKTIIQCKNSLKPKCRVLLADPWKLRNSLLKRMLLTWWRISTQCRGCLLPKCRRRWEFLPNHKETKTQIQTPNRKTLAQCRHCLPQKLLTKGLRLKKIRRWLLISTQCRACSRP